jgi:hypothetical protein
MSGTTSKLILIAALAALPLTFTAAQNQVPPPQPAPPDAPVPPATPGQPAQPGQPTQPDQPTPATPQTAPPAKPADTPADSGTMQCDMTFNLRGWSAGYATSKGDGTITCDNGETMNVLIHTNGGGLTVGKTDVVNGTGHFYGATSIDDVLGSYAESQAHAEAGKGGEAEALKKGHVNLTLHSGSSGAGVGFSFGKFTIERAPGDKHDKNQDKDKQKD